jgi:hypothetical protein
MQGLPSWHCPPRFDVFNIIPDLDHHLQPPLAFKGDRVRISA